MRYKIGIVIIAYNRPNSLKRLLKSLDKVCYSAEDQIELIISVDKSDVKEMYEIAQRYNFEWGQKKLIFHKENLGLREHVLRCGDLSQEYDAVIVLEDDLVVSPEMYSYATSCLSKYDNDSNIAGISLYTHLRNFHNDTPFSPIKDHNDVFFMQVAQSWGQVWTKKMWKEFRDWYNNFVSSEMQLTKAMFPKTISSWGNKSWLKFFMIYIYEQEKFFIYPYQPVVTNFTEIGTHNKRITTNYQIPLHYPLLYTNKEYHLPDSVSSGIQYDIYFENLNLKSSLSSYFEKIIIDLSGFKWNCYKEHIGNEYKYLLSSALLPFATVKTFSREMRPIENNIFYEINGNQIFLYDLNIKTSYTKKPKDFIFNELSFLEYTYKLTSTKLLFRFFALSIYKKILFFKR